MVITVIGIVITVVTESAFGHDACGACVDCGEVGSADCVCAVGGAGGVSGAAGRANLRTRTRPDRRGTCAGAARANVTRKPPLEISIACLGILENANNIFEMKFL